MIFELSGNPEQLATILKEYPMLEQVTFKGPGKLIVRIPDDEEDIVLDRCEELDIAYSSD